MDNDNKIELTQADMDMGVYILSILKSQPTILMSWGFQSPAVVRLGLRLKVSGFKLKGTVEIKYNEGLDLFDLTFYNVDGSVRNTLVGVYFDELVDSIDLEVERVENYTERVNEEYNIINYDEEVI